MNAGTATPRIVTIGGGTGSEHVAEATIEIVEGARTANAPVRGAARRLSPERRTTVTQ